MPIAVTPVRASNAQAIEESFRRFAAVSGSLLRAMALCQASAL